MSPFDYALGDKMIATLHYDTPPLFSEKGVEGMPIHIFIVSLSEL